MTRDKDEVEVADEALTRENTSMRLVTGEAAGRCSKIVEGSFGGRGELAKS